VVCRTVGFRGKTIGNNAKTKRFSAANITNVHLNPARSLSNPPRSIPILAPILAMAIRMENIEAAILRSVAAMAVAKKLVS
jgi:hypothetical protein